MDTLFDGLNFGGAQGHADGDGFGFGGILESGLGGRFGCNFSGHASRQLPTMDARVAKQKRGRCHPGQGHLLSINDSQLTCMAYSIVY